jgi:hypothetical protein
LYDSLYLISWFCGVELDSYVGILLVMFEWFFYFREPIIMEWWHFNAHFSGCLLSSDEPCSRPDVQCGRKWTLCSAENWDGAIVYREMICENTMWNKENSIFVIAYHWGITLYLIYFFVQSQAIKGTPTFLTCISFSTQRNDNSTHKL